ncbi:MAG: phosphoribosylamine--glycine ligase [Treponema sp.]|jgi:phosphoribosylamine--glycine ligase|nr:phosphoribosylamine--glycine ligase [Treponema sp.]
MKILVIGSGGREHAVAWKLALSDRVEKVYLAPGNGGTAAELKCENIAMDCAPASAEGQAFLAEFAAGRGIDLCVVGPEAPLAAGIVDTFRSAGLAVLGPDRNATRLEASKVWAKNFMEKYGVRTAKSTGIQDYGEALRFAAEHFGSGGAPPLVIKADGLAAGKGVVIAENHAQAERCITSFMKDGSLGDAGKHIVFEEYLSGREVSVLAAVSICRGMAEHASIRPFIPARDHKRRFDGDTGPNTGGMGAVAPVPDFTAGEDFRTAILEPTLRGIATEGMDYRGFIFFGLMVVEKKCFLLEYNVRLGDPETQAVLPLMDSDFALLCRAIEQGGLRDFPLAWKNGAVCAPGTVSEGYPGAYRKGVSITVDGEALAKTGAKLFIAGAGRNGEGGLVSQGGRVLTMAAYGRNADEAWERAYRALDAVRFEGMDFRRDIGRSTGGVP